MNELSRESSNVSHRTLRYRKKMQKINQNHGLTNEVLQIDMDGNIIKKFKNCCDAARYLFGEGSNKDRLISRCARGKCKSAYGFVWTYERGDSPHEL